MGNSNEAGGSGAKRLLHLRAAPIPTKTQEMMAFDPAALGGSERPSDVPANAVETRCAQWVAPADVCETAQQARRRARDEARAICQPCLTFAAGDAA